MIAMADYTGRWPAAATNILRILQEQCERGEFILKTAVSELEGALAAHAGRRHAVCVGSGTAALTLSLQCAGVGPGDDVIVPAFCYVAAASSVVQAGARPVFADVDPLRFTIDAETVAQSLTPRTKAVIAAHVFAGLCDMPAVAATLPEGVVLVEDSATAFGARLGDKAAGALGDFGVYSFFPAKPLGGIGDGGVMLTDDTGAAELARMLRNHGQDGRTRFVHHRVGANSRMDDINARWLLQQLPRNAVELQHKQALALRYDAALAPLRGRLQTQQRGTSDFSPHAYVVRTPQRDALAAHLAALGIETRIYFAAPLPAQPAFGDALDTAARFPVAHELAAQTLALPLHPAMQVADVGRVVDAVKAYFS